MNARNLILVFAKNWEELMWIYEEKCFIAIILIFYEFFKIGTSVI